MSELDLANLRAKAEAAVRSWQFYPTSDKDKIEKHGQEVEAAFQAACTPETIIALLDRIDAAERALRVIEQEFHESSSHVAREYLEATA